MDFISRIQIVSPAINIIINPFENQLFANMNTTPTFNEVGVLYL